MKKINAIINSTAVTLHGYHAMLKATKNINEWHRKAEEYLSKQNFRK